MTLRVTMVRISVQETLFQHWVIASMTALALITVLKSSPVRERLSKLSFFTLLFIVDTIITDASQLYMSLDKNIANRDKVRK
ncbi:hypothetical protein MA16_Dca025338 [Dendrobium catenatum]|uniref:Uncharacterized protein n=1 Tax=Dendrobium catenatum TaxID=906689 RepID=A0A2I0XGK4_9ASPA|nr:hypothetical protein MA16_Dca025338 [Dendrobium catenatum]